MAASGYGVPRTAEEETMSTTTLPVTVAATRRALADRGQDLERWAAQLGAAAAEFPGRTDVRVRRRRVRGSVEVTLAVTFASAAAAHAWETSRQRAELMADGDVLTDGEAWPATMQLPAPARWRTALVVWAGLFPFALALNVWAAGPLAALPVLPRTVFSTAVLVPLAVYLGIPAVQRLLARQAGRRRRG
jgi:uncharacterized protein